MLIFDFDGLILDTETPRFKAWAGTYRVFGRRLRLEDYVRIVGGDDSAFDFRKNLEHQCGRPIAWEKVDADRRAFHKKLMGREKPQPVILRLIQEAHREGLRLAVASSSPASWIKPLLEKHGLAPLFECVVTAENGLKAKPAPDTYNEVLRRLGCGKENALAFEDSPHGLQAAKRAGIACAVLPNRITRRLEFDRPDLLLRPWERITLAGFFARLRNR